jgi:uncharacterized protein (TIGR03382 family)
VVLDNSGNGLSTVPEPGAASLLVGMLLYPLSRRRRRA